MIHVDIFYPNFHPIHPSRVTHGRALLNEVCNNNIEKVEVRETYCCVLCRVWIATLIYKTISTKRTIYFCYSFYYERRLTTWILRGSRSQRATWVSVTLCHRNSCSALAQHLSAVSLSRLLTWVWEEYRRFRILTVGSWIHSVLALYSKTTQRQSITFRMPRPRGIPDNRWSFWTWPSLSVTL